jgi:deazaflavin-dependent oxidoreductase (nitroreductase family)
MNEPEPQFLYLTTTGRITGRPHEIEIWFVGHNGRYYLVSEKREQADWVRNLLHQPAVTFRVGDHTHQGHARPIHPEQEPDLAAAVSTRMDAKYEWSNGLIVELSPVRKVPD